MKLVFALLLSLSLHANGHILYLMKKGQVSRAVQEYRQEVPSHDFELLREMALVLLQSSSSSQDGEEQLLALFGAGITENPALFPLFRASLNSRHPEVQAAAINLLAHFDHDEASDLLKKNLSSPFLLIRLEALHHLASLRDPDAVGQLESLMAKIPPEVRPLFPQLFAMVGSTDADRILKRFLADRDRHVRRAAILTLAENQRDDYLPEIRQLAKQLNPLQQEVCAAALGALQDSSALTHLDRLSYSPHPTVRVAALRSLYQLGKKGARFHLESIAKKGDPFAVMALGQMEDSERCLQELLARGDLPIRINATAALLERKSAKAIDGLEEMLITDSRDLGFVVQFSAGGALPAIRPIASLQQHLKENPSLIEVSRSLRETLLVQAAALPETDFLKLAERIFEKKQNDLVPLLVTLLESMATDGSFALLEKQTKRVGAPLIRNYCNLALFRAGRDGPYEENLHTWIRKKNDFELFQLRPLLSWDQRSDNFTLTPEETSRLLIESFEALAHRQDTIAVDALLDALQNGNPRNYYPLAGLLFRITE